MAALARAVETMDRLRSPGGCPWDAEQTHRSLARYLLEETYETLEAIETDDPVLLREELGDLLLQVLFHSRIAEELPADERFGIAEVASDLVAKLVRRHPHVFARPSDSSSPGSSGDPSAGEVQESWDQLKVREKGRVSLTDGIPTAQPALALAGALAARVRRAQIAVVAPAGDDVGARLFAVVGDAVAAGIDPETALRETARAYRAAIIAAEASQTSPGSAAPSG
jgi:XTP/dITP diphosphohydrolase